MVTHNIEEAVSMCDRVLIFSTNPGRIVGEIGIDLPQPRDSHDPGFRDLVERIYVEMTARPGGEARGRGGRHERVPGTGTGRNLPRVSVRKSVVAGNGSA